MLHLTNGDGAAEALRAAGVAGDVLPWRDILHEGPVRADLDPGQLRDVRTGFLADMGWADREAARADMAVRDERLDAAIDIGEEIVLWFETDLYDMLQLAQVVDRLPPGRATLVLVGERAFASVAALTPDEVRDGGGRARRVDIGEEIVGAVRAAWAAFRAPDPGALEPLAGSTGTPVLPALGEALRRHQQQYPWRDAGLNRSERALLEAVANGASTPAAAFVEHQRREERPFLGDATAFEYLRRLALGASPLLDGDRLTPQGRAVLDGEHAWEPQRERWLGGVRLPAGAQTWEYDPAAGRIIRAG